jgi:hypothetical protein
VNVCDDASCPDWSACPTGQVSVIADDADGTDANASIRLEVLFLSSGRSIAISVSPRRFAKAEPETGLLGCVQLAKTPSARLFFVKVGRGISGIIDLHRRTMASEALGLDSLN